MSQIPVLGVSDHGGWAVLVTAARNGALLDRRRVELVDDSLPALPHHHEGQLMALESAIELVARVRASAEQYATQAIAAVANDVPEVAAIALRVRPTLPATVAERLTNYRARNVADWVMYREALADAAEERGWRVHWYDARKVGAVAAHVLGVESFDAYFAGMRRAVGPPWNNDHRLAMAAAICCAAPPKAAI